MASRVWLFLICVCGLAVSCVIGIPARADTTLNSGTTTISTGTNFGTRLYVASTGTAALNIVTGGYATNAIGYLGNFAGSLDAAAAEAGLTHHEPT